MVLPHLIITIIVTIHQAFVVCLALDKLLLLILQIRKLRNEFKELAQDHTL